MMNLLYFAWVRERIGVPKEAYDTQATTVAELIDELTQREERSLILHQLEWRWIRT